MVGVIQTGLNKKKLTYGQLFLFEGKNRRGIYYQLYIESEINNIAVFNNIFLTFQFEQSLFLHLYYIL